MLKYYTGIGNTDWFDKKEITKAKDLADMECQEFLDEIRGGVDRYFIEPRKAWKFGKFDNNSEDGCSAP